MVFGFGRNKKNTTPESTQDKVSSSPESLLSRLSQKVRDIAQGTRAKIAAMGLIAAVGGAQVAHAEQADTQQKKDSTPSSTTAKAVNPYILDAQVFDAGANQPGVHASLIKTDSTDAVGVAGSSDGDTTSVGMAMSHQYKHKGVVGVDVTVNSTDSKKALGVDGGNLQAIKAGLQYEHVEQISAGGSQISVGVRGQRIQSLSTDLSSQTKTSAQDRQVDMGDRVETHTDTVTTTDLSQYNGGAIDSLSINGTARVNDHWSIGSGATWKTARGQASLPDRDKFSNQIRADFANGKYAATLQGYGAGSENATVDASVSKSFDNNRWAITTGVRKTEGQDPYSYVGLTIPLGKGQDAIPTNVRGLTTQTPQGMVQQNLRNVRNSSDFNYRNLGNVSTVQTVTQDSVLKSVDYKVAAISGFAVTKNGSVLQIKATSSIASAKLEYRILDTSGKEVETWAVFDGDITRSLPAGAHRVEVRTQNGDKYSVVGQNIADINVAPTTTMDTLSMKVSEAPKDFDVLANDVDGDGDKLRTVAAELDDPTKGVIQVVDGKVVRVTPGPGVTGLITGWYDVTDDKGHTTRGTFVLNVIADVIANPVSFQLSSSALTIGESGEASITLTADKPVTLDQVLVSMQGANGLIDYEIEAVPEAAPSARTLGARMAVMSVALDDSASTMSALSQTTAKTYRIVFRKVASPGQDREIRTLVGVVGASSTQSLTISIAAGEQADTTKPVITLNGPSTLTLNVGDTFVDPGVQASDERDGDLTAKVTRVGSVDTSKPGEYSIGYLVEDKAGNMTLIKRTVIVKAVELPPDTTAPIISIAGSDTYTINLGDSFVAPKVTAMDERDGAVTVTVEGSVDTTKPGLYTLTYTAKDKANNVGTQTITVTVNPPLTVEIPADSAWAQIDSQLINGKLVVKDNAGFPIDPIDFNIGIPGAIYSVANIPESLSINPSTGIISGVYDTEKYLGRNGEFTMTITAIIPIKNASGQVVGIDTKIKVINLKIRNVG